MFKVQFQNFLLWIKVDGEEKNALIFIIYNDSVYFEKGTQKLNFEHLSLGSAVERFYI